MADSELETPTVLSLPIQPTGSGIADLEMMRELDALEADGVAETMDDPERADDGKPFGDVTASGAE